MRLAVSFRDVWRRTLWPLLKMDLTGRTKKVTGRWVSERLLRFVRGSGDKIFGQFGHFLATLPTFKNRVWPQEVFVDE